MSTLKAQITEKDQAYVSEFSHFLIETVGAIPTADPLVFELPDDSKATELYHGLELLDQAPTNAYLEESSYLYNWLQNYTGNVRFYLSLKSQLESKGSLSEKQVKSVREAILQEKTSQVESAEVAHQPTPVQQVREFSIKPGQIIVVGKWMAKQIAEKSGYSRPHYVFEVMEVEAETEKAYKMKVKLSAQRTIYCGVCGTKLTNSQSIAIGIGPICADKSGISYEMGALNSLADKLQVTVVVSTWIPNQNLLASLSVLK